MNYKAIIKKILALIVKLFYQYIKDENFYPGKKNLATIEFIIFKLANLKLFDEFAQMIEMFSRKIINNIY